MVLHIIWGRRLIRNALNHRALDTSQFALPEQTCNNAMLNKVLFCDLSRQTLSAGVLTDYDATAAFDRAIAGVSIVSCKLMGLPLIAGHFMFNLLKNMQFHLVTGFGKSAKSFHNTSNNITGQGVLQDSSSAAPIFFLNSDISLSTYKKNGTGSSFSNPINGTEAVDFGVQFVDNTSQFLNKRGIQPSPSLSLSDNEFLASYASKNAQLWSDLQWVSGGQINLSKCFYYAFKPSIN
jgi:hypothetical protein